MGTVSVPHPLRAMEIGKPLRRYTFWPRSVPVPVSPEAEPAVEPAPGPAETHPAPEPTPEAVP